MTAFQKRYIFSTQKDDKRNAMELKIEYVSLDTLRPYEKNARSHGKEDIKAIIESIKDFGFNDPIGVWHDIIVEGHGRWMAGAAVLDLE